MRKNVSLCVCAGLLISLCVLKGFAFAGEQGHYAPAPMAVRDYAMPPKGFYVIDYKTYYHAEKMKDSSGDNLESIRATGTATKNVNLGGHSVPVTLNGTLNVDLDFSVHAALDATALLWVTDKKILGADYAFMVIPSWGYTSVNVAAKATAAGTLNVGPISKPVTAGAQVKVKDEQWGMGDLIVQPLWLGWRAKNYDLGFSYAAQLPTGTYDKDNIANVGLGFCSQHLQANGYYYPFENKATAFMFTPTWEWNSKKIDEAVTPGQTMTIEYGISQYVHPRVELGFTGYNQWQVTKDSGSAAADKSVKDAISGVGAQLTWWALKEKCSLTAKVSQEYAGKDRFEGMFSSLNMVWIF